jgi:hypothetical protein
VARPLLPRPRMTRDARPATLLLGLFLAVASCEEEATRPVTLPDGAAGDAQEPTNGPDGGAGDAQGPMDAVPAPTGRSVTVALPPEGQAEVDRLEAIAAGTKGLTAEQLGEQHRVPFRPQLGYDPRAAVNLALVQSSKLKLTPAELDLLGKNGFAIAKGQRFPHFAYGYQTIYMQDLPVFISADSIMQAVHQSYDDILKAIELEALLPELGKLIAGMRAALPGLVGAATGTKHDLDLFLAVAASLLDGKAVTGVAGATRAEIEALLTPVMQAEGHGPATFFGATREIDYSQFKPRGHYAGDMLLERYFRAMAWLGRIDLPLLQTEPTTGKQLLVRDAVAGALALRALLQGDGFARWKRIDATVRGFVGEPDSMAPPDADRLKADLSLPGIDIAGVTDQALATALVAGAYGKQKILSQIVIQDVHVGETWPLDATFALFGQRYVFDAHVLSNVVYDRVGTRLMPDPLDVAYAALGNDQAAALLAPELKSYAYAPALEAIRLLGDEHGATFWDANLYNLWLGALRALSPGADVGRADSGLPAVAATEPWGRRLLNTQLASWSQLRHDTVLYAKPSYTTGASCEFPDAYVEPYPVFFARIEKLAAAGAAIVAQLPLADDSPLAPRIRSYFMRLGEVAGILRRMAEHQRTGMPHSAEDLAFINRAVSVWSCSQPPIANGSIDGWYKDLFFAPEEAANLAPVITDVHTQPTDLAGADLGRVLHAGTGLSRLMIVTVDTCMGPRAYAGVVSSYHQVVTEHYQRLTDFEWHKQLLDMPPADVPWMGELLAQ